MKKCGIEVNSHYADEEGLNSSFHSGAGTFARRNCGAIDAIQLWDEDNINMPGGNGQPKTGEFVIEGWPA